ncbi:MAG TPA: hypothetical protein VHX52_03600 [Steroidobacteraceae bacterium]|jgi:hypothetical protein|nr:hypothetical protein [Steroidobacteraceae bacterium]
MFPSKPVVLLAAVALMGWGVTLPARAATRYIGLIGPRGPAGAPQADSAGGLQRVNIVGYGSAGYEPAWRAAHGADDVIAQAAAPEAYGDGYDDDELYGVRQPRPATTGTGTAASAGAAGTSAPPVPGVPAPVIMLLAGLGLLSMIARRRTVLR